jgi:hypothetical protein
LWLPGKNMIEAEKRPIGNEGQVVVRFIFAFDDIGASRLHSVDIVSKNGRKKVVRSSSSIVVFELRLQIERAALGT